MAEGYEPKVYTANDNCIKLPMYNFRASSTIASALTDNKNILMPSTDGLILFSAVIGGGAIFEALLICKDTYANGIVYYNSHIYSYSTSDWITWTETPL